MLRKRHCPRRIEEGGDNVLPSFWPGQKVTVSDSNRGKLPVRRNGCTLTMQLPVGKIASRAALHGVAWLIPLQHRGKAGAEPCRPPHLWGWAPRTIQQATLAARSQEARRALGKGTSASAPLSEQHIQASLSALGDALAQAKAAVQGEAEAHFAISDALQRIATPYGSSATPLIAGNELRAVRFDPLYRLILEGQAVPGASEGGCRSKFPGVAGTATRTVCCKGLDRSLCLLAFLSRHTCSGK